MLNEMIAFGLLVGHLVGDLWLGQNDWMAANKANPWPGFSIPWWLRGIDVESDALYDHNRRRWWIGNLACTVHCLLYTFFVWLCACWWMPVLGLVIIFLTHWMIDRFSLAGRCMRNISSQKFFANTKFHPMGWGGPFIVDQTMHLVVLFIVGVITGVK